MKNSFLLFGDMTIDLKNVGATTAKKTKRP